MSDSEEAFEEEAKEEVEDDVGEGMSEDDGAEGEGEGGGGDGRQVGRLLSQTRRDFVHHRPLATRPSAWPLAAYRVVHKCSV